MENYQIKKISNGEYKETEKTFNLNVTKYCSNKSVLYFDVEGEDIPTCFDVDLFYNIMVSRIQSGLVESMKYDNGSILVEFKDGNVLRKYTYNFGWDKFSRENHTSANTAATELKEVLYKLVSLWNEDPNRELNQKQKNLRVVFDIIDCERIPIYENEEDLLSIFEAYNQNKSTILNALLDNVVFFDDDGNPIFFTEFVRERKLKEITEEVIGQMEASMVLFALKNDAVELYQKYLKSTFIPKRELVYHYVDEQGEEHYLRQDEFDEFNGEQPENGEEAPEKAQPEVPAPVKTPEEYDLAREQLVCLKELLLAGANAISEKLDGTRGIGL